MKFNKTSAKKPSNYKIERGDEFKEYIMLTNNIG